MRLVYGVGFNDRKYPSKENGKTSKEYALWNAMLYRCYSPRALNRDKTYIDCYVCDNFKNYSYFYEWCQNQVGFIDGFELDKDILVKGNKIYSENMCVFIPHELNSILNSCKSARGESPIGVMYSKAKKTYRARISKKNKRYYVGQSKDKNIAFRFYKKAKEEYLKEIALEYRELIDDRVYLALINYSVDGGD